jgi:flagellar protein FlaG
MIRPLDVKPPSTALAAEGVAVPGDGRQAPTNDAAATGAAPTRAEVEAAVDVANHALGARDAALEFRIDPDTRSVVVRLVDTQSNQVLRQVPSEEMLAIAKAVDRFELTLLHNQA